MDRAEAIKFAEYAQIMAMDKPEVQEFYKLAEAALQEQEQREHGCEYCDGTDKDLYFHEGACSPMNDHVYVSGNRVECDFGCKAWGAFEINFCPMCGRKLKEGAEG